MATHRYRSKQGKLVDVNFDDTQRHQVEEQLARRGFTFVQKEPTDSPPRMSIEEFHRLMAGPMKGLLGPQPNGSIGPV
jgi:hypothetical protein